MGLCSSYFLFIATLVSHIYTNRLDAYQADVPFPFNLLGLELVGVKDDKGLLHGGMVMWFSASSVN